MNMNMILLLCIMKLKEEGDERKWERGKWKNKGWEEKEEG